MFLPTHKFTPCFVEIFKRYDIVIDNHSSIFKNHERPFQSYPPPRGLPGVILKQKEAYQLWLRLHKDFPRVERLGIGQKIENTFLIILELTYTSAYLPTDQKMNMLSKTISKLDVLKFFVQLAWESKLISQEKYIDISTRLLEIGRMLGGWRKGLETKLPS